MDIQVHPFLQINKLPSINLGKFRNLFPFNITRKTKLIYFLTKLNFVFFDFLLLKIFLILNFIYLIRKSQNQHSAEEILLFLYI